MSDYKIKKPDEPITARPRVRAFVKTDDGWSASLKLNEYIEKLLLDGKRSQHEDFQVLFRVFGKDRIVEMAKEILAKHDEEKQRIK